MDVKNFKFLVLSFFLLVTKVSSEPDYSPCDLQVTPDGLNDVKCYGVKASEVGEAFTRNAPNPKLRSLDFFVIPQNEIDQVLDQVLDSVTSSYDTVSSLVFQQMSKLKHVPTSISRFTALQTLVLESNSIGRLTSGAVTLTSSRLRRVAITYAKLTAVEPGAFVGDFSRADIQLSYNSLTKLDEAVFRELLESKFNTTVTSHLKVDHNPIVCDCDLAWLVRDNLLPLVEGTCLKGNQEISFTNLTASDLGQCF